MTAWHFLLLFYRLPLFFGSQPFYLHPLLFFWCFDTGMRRPVSSSDPKSDLSQPWCCPVFNWQDGALGDIIYLVSKDETALAKQYRALNSSS